MLAKVYSCAVIGLEGAVVEVEVDTANGLPSFVVVGSKSQCRSPAYGKAGETGDGFRTTIPIQHIGQIRTETWLLPCLH